MKVALFFIFVFSFFVSFSQPVINFTTNVHDFGRIKEVNGAVSYDFEFINQGNAPVIIKNVESSCGCTSPQWSKQPVLPGKKGFVKAIFDPKDRPGYFDKTITVFSNSKTPAVELKIKGSVEGRVRTLLDDYPYELPSGLRLSLEHISLMKVKKGDRKEISIGVYNNSGRQLNIAFSDVPPHMGISVEPRQLGVKGTGVIKASYNTSVKGEFGLNEEDVNMVVDGKKYILPVSVFIEEDLGKPDPQKDPIIDADKKYYNFGQTNASRPLEFAYQIKNTGKSVLKIHRFYTNDDRVTAQMAAKELKPGESAVLTVKTKKGAEAGKVSCLVSIITNCPSSPEFNLRFYGEIIK